VGELWEEVNGLHSVGKDEREIERIVFKIQQLEKPKPPSAIERQAVSDPIIKKRETSREGGGWIVRTAGTKNQCSALPEGLQL